MANNAQFQLSLPRLIIETIAVVKNVWLMRLFRSNKKLPLPPTNSSIHLSRKEIDSATKKIENIVKLLIFWRRQRCVYRSYSLASILRKRGVNLIVNYGYINLTSDKKNRGHCWLTLDGLLFHEPASTSEDFPIMVGEESENGIVYWVGE